MTDRTAADKTVEQELASAWERQDRAALTLVACIEITIFLAGAFRGAISLFGCAVTAAVVGLELTALGLMSSPSAYTRWRLPLISATRAANMVLYPMAVDLLAIMDPRAAPDAAGALASNELTTVLATAVSAVHATALLVVPVAGVHACLLVALYWQLPPWLHLGVQAGSVAALMARAPSVCRQYVTLRPVNRRVAEAAHRLLRQAAAVVEPGMWEGLEAAGARIGPVEKCSAVAWTLQVSVGLVLATLLLWRQQLRLAQRHLDRQERREGGEGSRASSAAGSSSGDESALGSPARDAGGPSAVPVEEVQRHFAASTYGTVVKPALDFLDRCGGWWLPLTFSALVAFFVAMAARPGLAQEL